MHVSFYKGVWANSYLIPCMTHHAQTMIVEESMEKCNYIISLTMINHQFLGGFPGDLEDTSQLDASHEYMPGGRN